MNLYGKRPQAWLFLLFTILLVLGIFFRFVNLEQKIYWHDEVVTSFRIAGYYGQEFLQESFDGSVVSVADLQQYQQLNPEKSLQDLIKSLATEDPQHPPLYYIMVRFWVQLWGDSVAVTRSLSAIISLLVFPCLYWLCVELFAAPWIGWVAIALGTISPFHILYAQEAREYSLWTVTTLLASAALLRAMRRQTLASWAIYTVSLLLGFYTFLFSVLVAIGHGIYLLVLEKFSWTKTVKAYLLASITAVILYLPWIVVVIANLQILKMTTNWTNEQLPIGSLIIAWASNLSSMFIDLGLERYSLPSYLIYLTILALVIYAVYVLCRQTPQRIWLLIVTLITVTPLALILPDLISGGQRSASARYFIPCYLGIQLAVAYLFASKLRESQRKRIWHGIAAVVLTCGVISCAISAQAQVWWNKVVGAGNPQIAQVINQTSEPLIISNVDSTNPANLISLSYLLDPQVKFQLVIDPNIPQIPAKFSNIFLFHPSEGLRVGIENQYNAKTEQVENLSLLQVKGIGNK
ncbi:MAG: hypothetical protein F6J92_32960 [Symploca sp. SIO1A3]|nr:hypothetical protein [Symploca sp. SIO1A3]